MPISGGGFEQLTELEWERASLVGENAEALSRMPGNEIRIGETRLQPASNVSARSLIEDQIAMQLAEQR
ncbi:hypothetical protein Q6D67_02160 [Haliea sp. E1-2-M8]|uniref:hypothetical protein n=1 Tax=Haliea sp. E1-2-M8 TaxID=3064706 RepID=UPI002722ADA4|nr:hypothetical protein [Haliea sp. E1-2-M8]MDO8860489.1 hypothetical protein [Haliea sp. E1-2-M8]